uniref:Uncharacterized protein n=1 Tax=Haemonchus placei TaxID=6290 RepID=A0A0N4W9P4_HAEPC
MNNFNGILFGVFFDGSLRCTLCVDERLGLRVFFTGPSGPSANDPDEMDSTL